MEYTKIEKETYNLHFIYSKRFKRTRIRINFRERIDKNYLSYRSMLVYSLFESTRKFPTRRLIDIESENLYDIAMGSFSTKSGNYSTLGFSASFLNENCTEKGNDYKSLDFFLSFIFDPNIKNNAFAKEAYDNSYNMLKVEIESKDDNPNRYAIRRFYELLAPNTSLALNEDGTLEDLDKITPSNLYEYYKNVLKNDLVDIYVYGDIDIKMVEQELDKYFINVPTELRMSPLLNLDIHNDKVMEIRETKQVKQSILLMGGFVHNLTDRERWYILPLYNYLLGGGTNSKLFREVREKNSLCYHISSSYSCMSSINVIHSTIDSKNYNKVVDLVKKNMEAMRKGDFTLEDIKEAIITKKEILSELDDSPANILNMYEDHDFLGRDLKDEQLKIIDTITKDEVVEVANKINIDLIYLLEGSKRDYEKD